MSIARIAARALVASAIVSQLGCDGSPPPTAPGTTVSGVASKGPLDGATVTVRALDAAGTAGRALGTARTSATGAYSVDVGRFSGSALVEVTGGTYVDEATGVTTTSTDTFRVALTGLREGESASAAVTPLTEIAVRRAGALTPERIVAANTLVANMIGGTDVVATLPADALVPSSASLDARNYGLVLAALSEMVARGDAASIAHAITSVASDLADDVLDATGARVQAALDAFVSSGRNATGLDLATAPAASAIATGTTKPIREWTGFIDLSGESYSLPSGIAHEGRSIWVSNYVNGGTGTGAPIIYRYDLGSGRSTGSIPSPSQWTTCLGFDGEALLAIDSVGGVRLFRLSPETGAILSSFPVAESGSYWGIAWDGVSFYVAEYALTASGPATRIRKYSASGESTGVVYERPGSFTAGGAATVRDTIRGLAYRDGTLWALVTPASEGAPFRLLNLSAAGAELSIADIPGTAGRDLSYLGYDGSFWTIELLPVSLADFSQEKRLVPFDS